MKQEWRTVRLGDLLKIQNGFAFSSKQFSTTEGMPLVRIRSLKSGTEDETFYSGPFDEQYLVNAGDLLIGMDGEFGCYEWKGPTALLNQRVCRLQDFNEELLPRFLYYGINSHLKAIESATGFTTVKHLSSSTVLNVVFPVPPLAEQQRIVRLLDEAFKGIALSKANAEQNLRNTRALCESYLRAAFTQGVLERDGGEEGQGGAISVSWPVNTLAEVCQLKPGKREARIKLNPADEVSFVPMEDLGVNSMRVKALKSRPLSDVAGSYTYFAEGDVLLAKITPCFENGKLGIATDLINGVGFGSSEYFVLRPAATVSAEWLYHYLNRESFRLEGAARMSGAVGHRRVTKEFIESYPIPVPLLSEQQRIISKLDELVGASDVLASAYVKKLAALDDLQKSLLNQAFRGELEAA